MQFKKTDLISDLVAVQCCKFILFWMDVESISDQAACHLLFCLGCVSIQQLAGNPCELVFFGTAVSLQSLHIEYPDHLNVICSHNNFSRKKEEHSRFKICSEKMVC